MDDYSSLAHRIAGGVADVRGCLILSRDGLILGSFPEDEAVVKPSWLRFAALGEPERSFVEFAGETWAYLRRGPYAAFAIAGVGVRPGLLLDQLEQVLMAAEEARTRRETLKVPESPAAFSGKPRTSLHPPAGSPLEPVSTGADARPWSRGAKPEPAESTGDAAFGDLAPVGDAAGTVAGRSDGAPASGGDPKPARSGSKDGKGKGAEATADAEPSADPGRPTSGSSDGKKRKKDEDRLSAPAAEASTPAADASTPAAATTRDRASGPSPDGGTPSDGAKPRPELELEPDAEVDRVLLAKEFSGLLQVEGPDDEAQS